MWRISFWLFFSIGYIIINNSIKADFNTYRPNRLHFLPYFFQSTLPVRGATVPSWNIFCMVLFQSTLPVRGATVKTRIIIRIFK